MNRLVLYIWDFFKSLTASFVCMLNIGISFSFIKLRSPTSNLCSAFLSIINLINKIANKNRIINTRFSRRTWQNNACQSLLFTHAFLFIYVPLSGESGQCVWALWFVQDFLSVFLNVLDVTTMVLLGQPHKRSVHISTIFFAWFLCSLGSLVVVVVVVPINNTAYWRCPSLFLFSNS